MTVADIKEYIDEQEKYARQQIENHEIKIDLKDHINILDNVRSMLDELEPKATKKWTLTTTNDFCVEQEEDAEYLITIHNKLTDTYYVRKCILNNVGQCYLATKSTFDLPLADNEEIIAYHKREILEPYLAGVTGYKENNK